MPEIGVEEVEDAIAVEILNQNLRSTEGEGRIAARLRETALAIIDEDQAGMTDTEIFLLKEVSAKHDKVFKPIAIQISRCRDQILAIFQRKFLNGRFCWDAGSRHAKSHRIHLYCTSSGRTYRLS